MSLAQAQFAKLGHTYAQTMFLARGAPHREACVELVCEESRRTWKLCLAGSAVAFEDGGLGTAGLQVQASGTGASPVISIGHGPGPGRPWACPRLLYWFFFGLIFGQRLGRVAELNGGFGAELVIQAEFGFVLHQHLALARVQLGFERQEERLP